MSSCIDKLTDIFYHKLSLQIESPDEDLLNTGLLDSMRLVELLLTIEQEVCIRINLEETDLDNFRSNSSISVMLGDQRRLNGELKAYVREPNVAVSIVTAQSRHVSVLGAVNQPGVHVIRGCSHLIDAISRAGGIRQDAGNSIKVTRTAIASDATASYR